MAQAACGHGKERKKKRKKEIKMTFPNSDLP